MTNYLRTKQLIALMCVFCLFLGMSLQTILLGAHVYKKLEQDAVAHFEQRVPVAYLTMKIRQNDRRQGIRADSVGTQDALVLTETIEGKNYETWLYVDEGSLYEVYIQQGDTFCAGDGEEVMALEAMTVTVEATRVQLSICTPAHKIIPLEVARRAER